MAPTIRIVSLRVGRRKGHPIPDRPTRRDPIPCSARTLRMQRAPPVLSYHTGQKIPHERRAEAIREATGTNDAEGMKLCGKRRKDPAPSPFRTTFIAAAPHRVLRAKNKHPEDHPPPRHRCIPARPPSPDRKEIDTTSVRDRDGCGASGRTATKKEDGRHSGRPPGFVRFRRKVLRKRVYDFD